MLEQKWEQKQQRFPNLKRGHKQTINSPIQTKRQRFSPLVARHTVVSTCPQWSN